ncbi:MAG: glycosyltransferase family 4 protein [Clostridium sp.]|nr:glycosyltransferase family 4 protein [Clostridium sp.]
MKIAIDSRSATLHAGSGIGTYTKNLVLNLLNINSSDKLNIIWTGDLPSDIKKDKADIFLISGRHGEFYERFYVPNLLIKNDIDLYHIPQNGIGFPFDSSINTIVTIHDLIPYIMPETVGKGYLKRFLRDMPYIISQASGIITVSEYSKKDILRFFPEFPEEKILVTPLAANTTFKPIDKNLCKKYIKDTFKIDSPFILYVGGFSKRKNVKELIISFKKVKNSLKKDYKLLIAGSLRDEGIYLKDFVSSEGLSDSIIFTGFIEDSILPILYNAAEAFVYPSLYEGFGLPPLEAMSCKTPVITSNLTSIPEVTSDAAILINPHNIDDLSSALITLLNNENLKDTLAEKGYKRSLNFTWKKTAKKTFDAYKKIMDII